MREAFSDVLEFHLLAGQAAPETFTVEDGTWSGKPALGMADDLRDAAERLRKIHDQLGVYAQTSDHEPSRTASLRARLMLEELSEVFEAVADGDLPGVADGLGDLAYVVVGSAVSYGIPLPAVWSEIQRANLSKFPRCPNCGGRGYYKDEADSDLPSANSECASCGGRGRVVVRDEHGKVKKPADWTPPDMGKALGLQGGTP